MIELYGLKEGGLQINNIDEIPDIDTANGSLIYVKVINLNSTELDTISELFQLNLEPLNNIQDIEISSHYVDIGDQLSLNLSIPIYSNETTIEEQNIHLIIKNEIVFLFMPQKIDATIAQLTKFRHSVSSLEFQSHLEYLAFQIGVISDYYADIVESISFKIKNVYLDLMKSDRITDKSLDLLTQYNFSNFLLRESVSEFQRINILLRKKYIENKEVCDRLELEIEDLSVVSEHIQYNFERISDLKTNINSKIELEQNKIFKILTMITVCVSLPTLIAGIYGMNFMNMPELTYSYSYPIVLIAIVLSFVLPLLYFKKKKWF